MSIVWDRRAKIVRVIDGDTVEALLDQGFGDTKRITLRLKDARAPERGQAGYENTRAFVEQWLLQRITTVDSWPFIVVTQRNRSDSEVMTFARYVADLYTADLAESLGTAINEYVAAQGYPLGKVHSKDL